MYTFDVSISSAVSTADRREDGARWTAVAHAARPDAALLARRQLPDRRADLPAGQPAAARAAAAGAHQAAAARPLGHVARPQPDLRPPEPADQRARRQRDLPGRPRPRRPGAGRPRLPRGHLLRGLSGGHAGRGGPAAPVPPLLDAGRHPQPRQRADAGLDPRGRRARLRAVARLRRGLRQPGPDRRRGGRRRRGGVGAAGRRLEGHQLPQPGPRRRRAADPAPQRLQDQRPDRAGPRQRRRHPRLPAGQRLRGPLRRGRRSAARAPGVRRDARPLLRPHPRHPAGGPASTASSSGRAGRPSSCARPKGWTGPKEVDGQPVEGTFRSHQVPLADTRNDPEQLAQLEAWMRSYQPGGRCSTPTASSSPSSPRSRRRATVA